MGNSALGQGESMDRLQVQLSFSAKDMEELEDFCREGIQLLGMSKNTYVLKKLLHGLVERVPKGAKIRIADTADPLSSPAAYIYCEEDENGGRPQE